MLLVEEIQLVSSACAATRTSRMCDLKHSHFFKVAALGSRHFRCDSLIEA